MLCQLQQKHEEYGRSYSRAYLWSNARWQEAFTAAVREREQQQWVKSFRRSDLLSAPGFAAKMSTGKHGAHHLPCPGPGISYNLSIIRYGFCKK
jgi:hypothetical protein